MPSTYLPEGPKRPTTVELDAFWKTACEQEPGLLDGPGYQVRWIGLDRDSTEQVIDLILAKDKTGTFTLPWIVEGANLPDPQVGDPIILIDYDGKPRLLVRLTKIHTVQFGEVTEEDIAIDGSPVRTLDVWRPLHTQYWTALLEPFGREVSDDMPVLVEAFELLAAA
jgi:uncharacterized protein YhfF